MKRRILLIIMIITLFSLWGCSESKTIENKENTLQEVRENEDSEWEDKEVESGAYEEHNSSHDDNHSHHHEDEHH